MGYREGDESVEEAEQTDHQEDLEEGDEDVGLRGRCKCEHINECMDELIHELNDRVKKLNECVWKLYKQMN